jgi:hypothetical protein
MGHLGLPRRSHPAAVADGARDLVRRLLLTVPFALSLAGCCSGTGPDESDEAYYRRVCTTAGMSWIEGTRTCLGSDGSYINLQPPKR